MWNKTRVTEALGIQYPIIQGPFGGRFSSVKLLATVSNLGGLGSFGLSAYQPEEIPEVGAQIKAATQKPYNLNLWAPLKDDPIHQFDDQQFAKWENAYAPYFSEANLPIPTFPKIKASIFDEQLEVVLRLSPPVVSFVFGLPSREAIRAIKQLGTKIIGAATTLEEALLLDDSEVDLMVVSGKEAGGHRPSFLKTSENSLNDTQSLVKKVLEHVRKPVIAAGGISNGASAWKYLHMGASAVQIGTAFLATEESGATPEHKEQLMSKDSFQTELSRAYTGRLARTISNTFSREYNSRKEPISAPYPLQSQLLSPLMKKYGEEGVLDKVAYWAGEPSAILQERTAEALFHRFVREINDAG